MNRTKIAALVGSALLICAADSQAAPTWTFTSLSQTQTSGSPASITMGGVTAQGWSNTNDGTPGDVGNSSATTAATYKLETAYLGAYGLNGLGVNNLDGTSSATSGDNGDLANNAPEHAMDNNQRYDSELFSFSTAVNLTSITTGWVGCAAATTGNTSVCNSSDAAHTADSDFTVWYYNGSGAPSLGLAGHTYSSLGTGWNLLGSYNGGSLAGTTAISNSTGIYSSYWLIGAYNETVGGYTATGVTAPGVTYDYFKISGLTGTPCTGNQCGGPPASNPEPGTLFLMGAGLIGLVRTTRRRQVLAA